jgi:hypothetical protein
MPTTDVLYIHPVSFADDKRIPMGVVGLMNSLTCSKRGLYADQVTDNDLCSARIVALDLHWMFHLRPVEELARRCKAVSPSPAVIVGGYTAGIFSSEIIKIFPVDFIILGDAEGPFRNLVESILGGRSWDVVPNLVTKTRATPHSYSLTAQDFSAADNLSVDWFPAYKKLLSEAIAGIPFVFIPVARGCHHDCSWCYGSRKLQHNLCKRPMVIRDAGSVRNDLVRCSENKEIREVSVIADVFELERLKMLDESYIDTVFSQRYDVGLYMEFYNLPPIERLERLDACFTRTTIAVSFFRDHGQSAEWSDLCALEALALWVSKRHSLRLLIYGDTKDPVVQATGRKLTAMYKNILLGDDSSWRIKVPYPEPDPEKNRKQFEYFYGLRNAETSAK